MYVELDGRDLPDRNKCSCTRDTPRLQLLSKTNPARCGFTSKKDLSVVVTLVMGTTV